MTRPASQTLANERKIRCNHLYIHHVMVAMLYVVSVICAHLVLSLPEANKDLVTFLSTGAILATFGSAIGAIGLIWQNDLLERVRLNVDIFFRDIYKQTDPWRRWPFLSRSANRKLMDGTSQDVTLRNPVISLDVGTHIIKIDLPTVLEDFFDLPLMKNWWNLFRFQKSAHTALRRRPKDEKNPHTGLEPSGEYMAYECMADVWKTIFKFRVARYIVHLGSGLTIAGACVVTYHLAMQSL